MLHIDMESNRGKTIGRRDFVRVGALSTLGLTMADLLRARAEASPEDAAKTKAKACIVTAPALSAVEC